MVSLKLFVVSSESQAQMFSLKPLLRLSFSRSLPFARDGVHYHDKENKRKKTRYLIV